MIDFIQTLIVIPLKFFLKIFSIGKFHKKRILFFSFFGKQYSCSPKYISEKLIEKGEDYEIAWAFVRPEDYSSLKDQGITLVKYGSLAFVRMALTSRFIFTNSEIPSWLPILRKQVYINTWHGYGAYKRVGNAFTKESRGKQIRARMTWKTPCIYVSDSKAFTDLTIRKSFGARGRVLEYGVPRNDILCNMDRPDITEKVYEYYKIPRDKHIFLYAPTYRESRKAEDYELNYQETAAALSERFGGEWQGMCRVHYLVMDRLGEIPGVIDASAYPDMQELLYAVDTLITDYSSSIWDYSFTGRPCFLYVTDLAEYDVKRGFYSDIHGWPFPLSESMDELVGNIVSFDEDKYREDVENHHRELGYFGSGHACEDVIRFMNSMK